MEPPPLPTPLDEAMLSLSESWRVWTGRMVAASPILKRHGGIIIECREDGWHAPNTVISQMQHCCVLQILHRSPRPGADKKGTGEGAAAAGGPGTPHAPVRQFGAWGVGDPLGRNRVSSCSFSIN
ncbi:hypothetical protein SORBI_3009G156750 [Sorghum bicolor]|uniref:Uncharacterized protein n=1 Tax=Sorghum bicolor TaxID=4558 RepID=A0A1Z5R2W7_SORBI|nr:hypothetical protein SORBI_3009G156750 [Sorghum bicolor]